jgi:hypothetical protein
MGLISSRRVHEGEKRRTSAGEDLDVFIVGIIIIIIFPLLARLHLARGRSSGLGWQRLRQVWYETQRGKENSDGVPLHPKGSSSSSTSMVGKVRYMAGRKEMRDEDVQSSRGSSSAPGRIEYLAGYETKEGRHTFVFCRLGVRFLCFFYGRGLATRQGGKGGWPRTHC